MIHSELKNTIDLLKSINKLQLNFNNQNLRFKEYSINNKYITFINKNGIDVNISLDELVKQYKSKYKNDVESSVDTSIFNLNNKHYSENINSTNNEELSATSVNSLLLGGNYEEFSQTSNSTFLKSKNSELSATSVNSILMGGNDEFSQTSNSTFLKSKNSELSATSVNSLLMGGNYEELSQTSINSLVGGNIRSLEEASVFDTVNEKKNNLYGGKNNNFSKTISVPFNKLKGDLTDTDSVNYESTTTLNSITDLKVNLNNKDDNYQYINKFMNQKGGNNKPFIKNSTKTYNINSSSTSSVCE